MKDEPVTLKLISIYLIILILILFCGTAFGQVKVVHYNADWNNANKVEWVKDLTDCKLGYVDIAANPDMQKKHEIVVVPTIIIFNGEEVKRFQADISFAMKATKEEVQEVVDEIIMDQF